MNKDWSDLIARKITATFVTTIIPSFILGALYISQANDADHNKYHQGSSFLAWSAIYVMYIGTIVLVYGNLVSLGLEYIKNRWSNNHVRLYVGLHGVFGLANGFIFRETALAFYGMAAALLYACIDRWVYKRMEEQNDIKMFYLIPVLILSLLWGYYTIISAPEPPFTKHDAVAFATSGSGTAEDDLFPKKIGKWHGTIEGYQVERETSAKKIGKEKYVVTFTEKWEKDGDKGTWHSSYEVGRGSSGNLGGETGDEPPYNRYSR
ncbi:hypothetical protein [Peribacillus sp. SCS-155]|uniref:hypothetical protein n=1 Tax=Peribacillus sedimenti TaxID=3115297 RepID=UPI00390698E6